MSSLIRVAQTFSVWSTVVSLRKIETKLPIVISSVQIGLTSPSSPIVLLDRCKGLVIHDIVNEGLMNVVIFSKIIVFVLLRILLRVVVVILIDIHIAEGRRNGILLHQVDALIDYEIGNFLFYFRLDLVGGRSAHNVVRKLLASVISVLHLLIFLIHWHIIFQFYEKPS